MTRGTVLKFIFLSLSNIKKLLVVNLIFLPPLLVFLFTAGQLLPFIIHYIDTMNITLYQVNPEYGKLVLVITSYSDTENLNKEKWAFVFKRNDFKYIRKYLFLKEQESSTWNILHQKALGVLQPRVLQEPFSIKDKQGKSIITLALRDVSGGYVEIFFINPDFSAERKPIRMYLILMIISYFILVSSLGGIADYIQRIVFHEIRELGYLFRALIKHLVRSIVIALIFTVVICATTTNIYFYLFISGGNSSVFIAALNFWMLIFFTVIFMWVYPLMALGTGESVFKMMRKSLFISFDNFDFTLNAIIVILIMGTMSIFSLFTLPGIAGMFSFLNTSLKEISSRYSSIDSA